MNYDTRLLHSNIAFPLLKKLTDVSDPIAKKVFKEEIGKRINSTHISTILFLVQEGYLDYLTKEEIDTIFLSSDFQLFEKIIKIYNYPIKVDFDSFSEADRLYHEIGKYMVKALDEKLRKTFKQNNFEKFVLFMRMLGPLDDSDLVRLIYDKELNLIRNIVKIFSNNRIDLSELIFGNSRLFDIISRIASLGIKDQLQEIIKKENPVELKIAIEIGLFQHLNDNDLKEIIENTYEPFLLSLVTIEEIGGYTDIYIFPSRPIEEALYDFTNENYNLVSKSLKNIIFKIFKKKYYRALESYFGDDYSLLGNIIKSKDVKLFRKIKEFLKNEEIWD